MSSGQSQPQARPGLGELPPAADRTGLELSVKFTILTVDVSRISDNNKNYIVLDYIATVIRRGLLRYTNILLVNYII